MCTAELVLGSPYKTVAKSAKQYIPLVLKASWPGDPYEE
jgi:hypothetical protein